jgi:hypothetical protein
MGGLAGVSVQITDLFSNRNIVPIGTIYDPGMGKSLFVPILHCTDFFAIGTFPIGTIYDPFAPIQAVRNISGDLRDSGFGANHRFILCHRNTFVPMAGRNCSQKKVDVGRGRTYFINCMANFSYRGDLHLHRRFGFDANHRFILCRRNTFVPMAGNEL